MLDDDWDDDFEEAIAAWVRFLAALQLGDAHFLALFRSFRRLQESHACKGK